MSKNICVFSFDHGFSLGLKNSNYNTYIAKRPSDFEMLHKNYGEKVIYIPCWNKDKSSPKVKYTPFNEHSQLITASASARFYKLQGQSDENYIDFVMTLLNKTKGKHVHIGPIEDLELNNIQQKMQELNIPLESFIHIPWANNIVESLLFNNVDIFIEPFPTVSYKITLEVLSAGIPVIAKQSLLRIEMADFLYPEVLRWETKEEFIEKLSALSAEDLVEQSISAREYFLKTHDITLLKEYFIKDKSLCVPPNSRCVDNKIIEINNVAKLFIDNCFLSKFYNSLDIAVREEKSEHIKVFRYSYKELRHPTKKQRLLYIMSFVPFGFTFLRFYRRISRR